jgi:uncharacterized protein (DUF1800 family)
MKNRKHLDCSWNSRRVAAGLLAILLIGSAIQVSNAAAEKSGRRTQLSKAFKGRLPITELTEDEAILHALNRLGFGPRPGDVERVRRMGLDKWINEQLNPQSIPDPEMNARLEHFPTLKMSTASLLKDFPPPALAAKQAGLTLEEYRRQQLAKRMERNQARRVRVAGTLTMDSGEAMNAESGGDNRNQIGSSVRPAAALPPRPPRLEDITGLQRVGAELALAKMGRAVYSERQLNEVMVDFWMNHFNVYADKGADRWLLTSYERDSIRPHVLGKFKDLLEATAKSPAMLFYLDNWQSVDPQASERMQKEIAERRLEFQRFLGRRYPLALGPPFPPPAQPPKPAAPQARRGLNENYGRELMELHTLGVDGGYTQKDVTEVARAFTGWTIRTPRRDAEFYFAERLHDEGTKIVLGKKIHAGGMKDGEEVLDLLAHHPSTAHFISLKIARRFVSDQPPQALVNRMAKTFRSSDGDIRAVLRTMIDSPEFWSRNAYRAKIKTPFELVASTARALGLQAAEAIPLVQWTARIGEPLYRCEPPTGYSDQAETWVNTGALLSRLNFALAFAGNRLPGLKVDPAALLGDDAARDPRQALDRSIQVFLGGDITDQSRSTLERKMNDPQVLRARLDDPVSQVNVGMIAGLVLGSPEFQRR